MFLEELVKTLLTSLIFLSFDLLANSFVAKGKIQEITLVKGIEVMVELSHQPHKNDCQGDRFYLRYENDIQLHNNLALLNTALANKYTITLHQTTGASYDKEKVFFDILRVQTY